MSIGTQTLGPGPEGEVPHTYIHLQPSEVAVLDAASRIFAAYVASNKVTKANERELYEHAVELAIQMAQRVENRVLDQNDVGA